jgi:hypothetical protein
VVVVALSLGAAGCGGGSSGSDDAGGGGTAERSTTTAPAADGGAERPEGTWALVSVELERSDQAEFAAGQSQLRLAGLEPTCDEGSCDVEVAPAGVDGTYLPEGVTPAKGAAAPEPYTLAWEPDEERYVRTTEAVSSCTTAEGQTVEEAYATTTVATLEFRPAEGGRPAALTGTYTETVTPTAAGGAVAGCTPFEERGAVFGTPEGEAAGLDDLDLAGTYVTTEVVEEVEPAGQRDPGFAGLLGEQTVAADGDRYTVTGILGEPAPLERSGDAFGGTTPEVSQPCRLATEVADGFTSTETWSELAPVGLDDEGRPILAGRWRLFENPTPAGVDGGCSLSSNTGHVLLVPSGAIP